MEAGPPQSPKPLSLILASLWACGAALAAREAGLPALAAVMGLLILDRQRAGRWTAALVALPAALAALQLPPARSLEGAFDGLTEISGTVQPGIRPDLHGGARLVPMLSNGREYLLILEGTLSLLPGDHLAGPVYMLAPSSQAAAYARIRLRAEAAALQHSAGGWSPIRLAEACRQALQDSLLRLIPGEEGRLLCHLVLGRGPPLPPDLVSAHRGTGLTHLLAVSGAHASMLAWMMGLLYRLCSGRRAWGSPRYRRTAGLLLMVYGAITGWEPPVFRALAAFALMLAAAARGRRLPIHSCLAFPALLTALLQPDELFSTLR